MAYKSQAQQGLFHSPNSPVSKSVVDEFDAASKGQSGLPYKVGQKKRGLNAMVKSQKKSRPKPGGNGGFPPPAY